MWGKISVPNAQALISGQNAANALKEWWPIIVGLLLLYVPTCLRLATHVWPDENHGHEPLVLMVVFYLLWMHRDVFISAPMSTAPVAGWATVAFGLVAYVIGRSQDVVSMEVFSMMPVLAGSILLARGWPGLKQLAFPVGFLAFMVPLPFFIIDFLTGWLKQHVSDIVTSLLFAVGYPISTQGVLINIGPYQLLMADACSGLNSLYTVTALGLLYMHLKRETSWGHKLVLLASLMPIAFFSNVIRVTILALLTFHLGDEVGLGFLKGFFGITVFIIAMLMLVSLDAALTALRRRRA